MFQGNSSLGEIESKVKRNVWQRNETFYFLDFPTEKTPGFPCMTTEESVDPNKPCMFPFIYKYKGLANLTYNICISTYIAGIIVSLYIQNTEIAPLRTRLTRIVIRSMTRMGQSISEARTGGVCVERAVLERSSIPPVRQTWPTMRSGGPPTSTTSGLGMTASVTPSTPRTRRRSARAVCWASTSDTITSRHLLILHSLSSYW